MAISEKSIPCVLVLETGDLFYGRSIGTTGTSFGELIFNTSMSGYQEILTDPSYQRQIVTMTYPEIGNYGVDLDENESQKIQVAGFVVKNLYPYPEAELQVNPGRRRFSLEKYLVDQKVVGIAGVDTRKITRILREKGASKSMITTDIRDESIMVDQVKKSPTIGEFDCIKEVTTDQAYQFDKENTIATESDYRIIVVDYGVKTNILRHLKKRASEIHVLPAYSTTAEILKYKPDGILLSNGPGDPDTFADNGVNTVRELIGKIPIFGICFGHQVLLKALDEETYKLKFGHHAANHPIKDLNTGKISITSQNHNYAVGESITKETGLSHQNLNDNTVAGFQNLDKLCFSVQYHPEAAPGPHDGEYLFDEFFKLIRKHKK